MKHYDFYDTESEDESYDIGVPVDPEKRSYFHHRSPTRSSRHDDDTSSSRTSSYGSGDAMLPVPRPAVLSARRSRPRSPGYFYRIPNRVVRWLCIALMSTVIVFILSLVRMGMTSTRYLKEYRTDRGPPPPLWQSFEFMERYYGGIRTLVPVSENEPEYPNDEGKVGWLNISKAADPPPTSAQQDFALHSASSSHKEEASLMEDCYLDLENKIPVPRLRQYTGVPLGFPEPIIGSAEALSLPNETCYDRYSKLGPYGYGYSIRKGGLGAGIEGEREGADGVWSEQPQIDYSTVRWHEAQTRCFLKNRNRFPDQPPDGAQDYGSTIASRDSHEDAAEPRNASTENIKASETKQKLNRTAVVVRTWSDFDYTPETILFLRSLISELALATGGAYTVHFLIHVKDDNSPIWADQETYAAVLNASLPAEFHGMGTLWSERQMGLVYGGLAESFYEQLPVHGVYRSVFMPLQYFAQRHPEYAAFWNVEMDVRYTGHWGVLLERLSAWARAQPRKGLWERSARFYVPSVHGSWEDFVQMVRVRSETPATNDPPARSKWAAYAGVDAAAEPEPDIDHSPIWGPRAPPDAPPFDTDPQPPTTHARDRYTWGVGEEADLLTLNPLFDPAGTDWRLAADVTGYNASLPAPPRRAAVVTTSRLSRRLLAAMHRETAHRRHAMFSEAWPASVALHHGLKAASAPHPIYVDRAWPPAYLERTFNAGVDGADARGRRRVVWGEGQMHNLKGVGWYYNSGFAPNLWRRWLGFRVDGGGGEEWEVGKEGRMCLPPMLLHPVKDVRLVVEGTRVEGEEDAK